VAVLELLHGDCRAVMAGMPAASVDAVVCDPPYGLSFMGKDWDHGIPGVAFWSAALRVAKPGAHLLAFGGTRTFHRLAVAIEDAGWEIRDTVMWVYGSGFPKSHDVGKGIDKAVGAEREVSGVLPSSRSKASDSGFMMAQKLATAPATDAARQWDGWGTALKPAWEPIIVARKPLEGTVAANVLAHGTGALNIDGCRVEINGPAGTWGAKQSASVGYGWGSEASGFATQQHAAGRWPANLIHDGSDEVLAGFPQTTSGARVGGTPYKLGRYEGQAGARGLKVGGSCVADTGSAARFFYCAKTNKNDRNEGLDEFEDKENAHSTYGIHSDEGLIHNNRNPENRTRAQKNHHPTVKPTALMRYLCKLVTPPNGTVLDPFMGSGSTGKAARMEGFGFIGIEQDADYIDIARARIAHAVQSPAQQSLHI